MQMNIVENKVGDVDSNLYTCKNYLKTFNE